MANIDDRMGDEWVEEALNSKSDLGATSSQEYEEFVEEECDYEEEEEEEEEVVEEEEEEEIIEEEEDVEEWVEEVDDDAEDEDLTDEQFISRLQTTFREMAKKSSGKSTAIQSPSIAPPAIPQKQQQQLQPLSSTHDESQQSEGVASGDNMISESSAGDLDLSSSYLETMSFTSHESILTELEQSCRELIATVSPRKSSMDSDQRHKLQPSHNLHNQANYPPNSFDSQQNWESFREQISPCTTESQTEWLDSPSKLPVQWDEQTVEDVENDAAEGSDHSPQLPITNDMPLHNANTLPTSISTSILHEAIRNRAQFSPVSTRSTRPQTEIKNYPPTKKWVERYADDPDDYETACCELIAMLYRDDEGKDINTMLRRTTPKDLYHYLKNEFWYMQHTQQSETQVAASSEERSVPKPLEPSNAEAALPNQGTTATVTREQHDQGAGESGTQQHSQTTSVAEEDYGICEGTYQELGDIATDQVDSEPDSGKLQSDENRPSNTADRASLSESVGDSSDNPTSPRGDKYNTSSVCADNALLQRQDDAAEDDATTEPVASPPKKMSADTTTFHNTDESVDKSVNESHLKLGTSNTEINKDSEGGHGVTPVKIGGDLSPDDDTDKEHNSEPGTQGYDNPPEGVTVPDTSKSTGDPNNKLNVVSESALSSEDIHTKIGVMESSGKEWNDGPSLHSLGQETPYSGDTTILAPKRDECSPNEATEDITYDQPQIGATLPEKPSNLVSTESSAGHEENKQDDISKNKLLEDVDVAASNNDESRLEDMAQILQFKRRVEKAKLSGNAKALENMKKGTDINQAAEKRRLDEDRKQAYADIHDKARVLEEKYYIDSAKIQEKYLEIQVYRDTELARLSSRVDVLEDRRKAANIALENEAHELEEMRLANEAIFAQTQKLLEEKILNAQTRLKTGLAQVAEATQGSVTGNEGKSGGFLGVFGARKKTLDLEEEKERQTMLLTWKLEEIELEREIKEAQDDLVALDEENAIHENAWTRQLLELEEKKNRVRKELYQEEEKLEKVLSRLEERCKETEIQLLETRKLLDRTHDDDKIWVAVQKSEIEKRYQSGLQKLSDDLRVHRRRQIDEEIRINNTAKTLKEKWLKEEAALAREIEQASRHKAMQEAATEKLRVEKASRIKAEEESEERRIAMEELPATEKNPGQEVVEVESDRQVFDEAIVRGDLNSRGVESETVDGDEAGSGEEIDILDSRVDKVRNTKDEDVACSLGREEGTGLKSNECVESEVEEDSAALIESAEYATAPNDIQLSDENLESSAETVAEKFDGNNRTITS